MPLILGMGLGLGYLERLPPQGAEPGSAPVEAGSGRKRYRASLGTGWFGSGGLRWGEPQSLQREREIPVELLCPRAIRALCKPLPGGNELYQQDQRRAHRGEPYRPGTMAG